jgi:DNA-binding NtrC family response regulator
MSGTSNEGISVLLVSAGECQQVEQSLVALSLELTTAQSCRQARERLGRKPPPSVVITETSLPDGNWCDVLNSVVRSEVDSAVIVCSSTADERLWSEAIWRGAYDLLVEPFDVSHVKRCVEGAHRSRHQAPFQRAASSGP